MKAGAVAVFILTLAACGAHAMRMRVLREKASKANKKSYFGRKGVEFWGDAVASCAGKSQSPIDIDAHLAVEEGAVRLPKIEFSRGYCENVKGVIENNGHTRKRRNIHRWTPTNTCAFSGVRARGVRSARLAHDGRPVGP